MKRFLTMALVCAVAAAGAGEWTPLFNGTDLSGWQFDTLDKAAPEAIWSVQGGVVAVAGKGRPNGVMRTGKSYANYELEVEWRWPGKPGNSGCLIHCSKPRFMSVWPQSIEAQLANGNAGDFWLIGERAEVQPAQIVKGKDGAPSRRRMNLVDGAEKPAGEWNRMRIVARGDTVEVYVNDQLVNKAWDLSTTEGAICLQAERADIEFRTVRIRSLTD